MNNLSVTIAFTGLLVAAIGCGASSGEEQRRALTYQQNSDEAAKEGHYGVAADNQQKAQDAHHSAVDKAIDEGKPIPPQPKAGDVPPARPVNP
jgi:hypothetical protein